MSWAYIRDSVQTKFPLVASLADPFELQVHLACEALQGYMDGARPGDPGYIVPSSRYISTSQYQVMIDITNVPAVGTNIHEVFNFYGEDPSDPSAWFNQGNVYTVQEYQD